ncbi:MAG: asparagine synthase (glutamine-hydrolyzing) [Anaerolineales bacterium]|nr:asparagine synthase (glutamine-hydrolyzing) [Anaerolineales bacterium]MCW5855757.1 asparagine synthase (glutamine-hydrolyzing) [Anaerolineales bacterium]
MCGIAGCVSSEELTSRQREQVSRLLACMVHRGPDGAGAHSASHAELAMRRLSIIDLDGGWQPIYNEDKSLAVVCNGEIYNYVELRAELETRGHRFYTNSDVETIVHLYEEHGLDFVRYLRGMFAIALWDENNSKLILARDRMGEKPLYYLEKSDGLYFASELKAILRTGLAALELNPASAYQYFHFQYVPDPATMVLGVEKLPAAHMLVMTAHPWQSQLIQYWHFEEADPIDADPATTLEAELDRASELVVRSDVPVGLALSGGVDSAIVAAFAAHKYPGVLQTFSVGYAGGAASDEREDARAVADYLKVPFTNIEINDQEMVDFFPQLVYWRDDPIADISGQGYYAVMKAASQQGVRVMLQGQGGDELFWGYDWVRRALAENRERTVRNRDLRSYLNNWEPVWPTGLSRAGLGPFLRSAGGLRTSWEKQQRLATTPDSQIILYELSRDFQLARKSLHPYLDRKMALGSYGKAMVWPFEMNGFDAPLEVQITKAIAHTYLMENGVAQGDRLGMASGVELRLPLLDHKLIETVVGLRKAQRDDVLEPKEWLKQAAAGRIPRRFLDKPKRGFEPPVRRWHQMLFERYGNWLIDGQLVQQGILSPAGAKQLAQGPFPKFAVTPISFKALVLETWMRQMASAQEPA